MGGTRRKRGSDGAEVTPGFYLRRSTQSADVRCRMSPSAAQANASARVAVRVFPPALALIAQLRAQLLTLLGRQTRICRFATAAGRMSLARHALWVSPLTVRRIAATLRGRIPARTGPVPITGWIGTFPVRPTPRRIGTRRIGTRGVGGWRIGPWGVGAARIAVPPVAARGIGFPLATSRIGSGRVGARWIAPLRVPALAVRTRRIGPLGHSSLGRWPRRIPRRLWGHVVAALPPRSWCARRPAAACAARLATGAPRLLAQFLAQPGPLGGLQPPAGRLRLSRHACEHRTGGQQPAGNPKEGCRRAQWRTVKAEHEEDSRQVSDRQGERGGNRCNNR